MSFGDYCDTPNGPSGQFGRGESWAAYRQRQRKALAWKCMLTVAIISIVYLMAACGSPTAPRPVRQHVWPSPTTITGVPPHAIIRGHVDAPIGCTDCRFERP